MADAAYDAIVIGGGHHGTIVSCYLAKAGLRVAVLEGHTAIGGGAVSEEAPAPGFRQNLTPISHAFTVTPLTRISIFATKDWNTSFPSKTKA